MALVILIGLVCSIAAGLACAAEHGYAEKHAWPPLWRYGAGALTWSIGIVPIFVGAVFGGLVRIEVAGLMYGLTCLVLGGMAMSTWACYRPPLAMPEEDELEAKINQALRKP